jgi:hypothetical protein
MHRRVESSPQSYTQTSDHALQFHFKKKSSDIIFNFNFDFKNRLSNGQLKRRRLGWHPRAQLKPNAELIAQEIHEKTGFISNTYRSGKIQQR